MHLATGSIGTIAQVCWQLEREAGSWARTSWITMPGWLPSPALGLAGKSQPVLPQLFAIWWSSVHPMAVAVEAAEAEEAVAVATAWAVWSQYLHRGLSCSSSSE